MDMRLTLIIDLDGRQIAMIEIHIKLFPDLFLLHFFAVSNNAHKYGILASRLVIVWNI